MSTKRLVLAEPATDGVDEFPYVDVRLWQAKNISAISKNIDEDGFFQFYWEATLAIRFYRISGDKRVFLTEDYTPVQRLLSTPNKIKAPSDENDDFDDLINVYLIIFWASVSGQGMSRDNLIYSSGPENSFEALGFSTRTMYPGLRVLLEQEGGPEFAGLTVVEDEE